MPTILTIDDPADPRIAAYRDIRERDLVGRQGLFVAEGRVVLAMLVAAPAYAAESMLVAAHRLASLADLIAPLPADVPVYAAEQPVLDAVAGFALHRGILAIGRRIAPPAADALLASLPACADVLVLCGIANHDNMGGLFRNAAAFGAGAVLIDADCCDPLYRKAIRVSVGGVLTVPFARLARGEDAISLLARHGFASLALTPGGDTALADVVPAPRNAVLLGAEGPGLADDLITRARGVRIAMAAGFDSLNVATTGGIVLHHLAAKGDGAR